MSVYILYLIGLYMYRRISLYRQTCVIPQVSADVHTNVPKHKHVYRYGPDSRLTTPSTTLLTSVELLSSENVDTE